MHTNNHHQIKVLAHETRRRMARAQGAYVAVEKLLFQGKTGAAAEERRMADSLQALMTSSLHAWARALEVPVETCLEVLDRPKAMQKYQRIASYETQHALAAY